MASQSAISTKVYGLNYGKAVKGLDKESGIKLSEEVANLLKTDGSKAYAAADFVLDASLPSSLTYTFTYAKGVNPANDKGGDKVYTNTISLKTLNQLAKAEKEVASLRKAILEGEKQISGSKAENKKGGGGGKKKVVYNFVPSKKTTKNQPDDNQPAIESA
jgi:hypothetical protein